MKFSPLFLFAAIVCLVACTNNTSDKKVNKYADPEMVRIAQLTDERKGAALLEYMSSANALYREEAAYAMASIQDSLLSGSLIKLLSDPEVAVRIAAAYSLGQCAHPDSTMLIVLKTENETEPVVRGALYEALGKIAAHQISGNKRSEIIDPIMNLLDASRFDNEDERLGWAKAVFWMNLAGNTDVRLMNRMPFVLQKTEGGSRVACAQAIARFKGDWFNTDKNKEYVLSWCKMERNFEVRVFQMAMLAKINDVQAKDLLIGYLNSSSQDATVKISALRAASKMNSIQAKDLLPLLDDTDDYVALECLNTLETKSVNEISETITSKCASRIPIIRAKAMRLAQSSGKSGNVEELWNAFQTAAESYDKVHFIHAMGKTPAIAQKCFEALLTEKEFAPKYALMETLIEMHQTPGWPASADYLQMAMEAFRQGDIGVQALIAVDVREQQLSSVQKQSFTTMMMEALPKLALPKEIETYNEIIRTLQVIDAGAAHDLTKAEFNHPIDWKFVTTIPSDQKVKFKTTKGEFVMQLRVNEAPGSVASFMQLASSGFYNDKFFHRVIPNFVIQGGCPRGDGMGGTDYTLRSEFRLHDYSAGAVGLASSGRDTESCQWFVSHISTPHLEGRYSIFAYVTSGMEVVKKILVGDKILEVEVVK